MADKEKSEGIYGLWKQTVPADYRWFLQSLFGDNTKPFTEKDYTKQELQMLDRRINEFDTNRLNKYKDDLASSKQQLNFINSIKPNANKFIKGISEDPEWEEFSKLFKIQNPTPKQHARYWELNNKLHEKYSDVVPSKYVFYGSAGKGPDEIQQLYKDEYSYRTNNEQLKNLKNNIRSLEDKIKNYSTLSGNVQYKLTTDDKLDTLQGDVIEQTLGRFNYNKLPDGKIQAIDNYDWMNEHRGTIINELEAMNPLQRAAWTVKNAVPELIKGNAGYAGNVIGTAYVGREGRPVNVTYDPKEINSPAKKKKGGKIKLPDGYKSGGSSSLI